MTTGPGDDYELLVADIDLPFVGGVRVTDINECDLLAKPICSSCCSDHESRLDAIEAGSPNLPVNNVAALTTLSAATDGAIYQTKGYYNSTDGGGNLYVYEEASVAACDGGFIIDGLGGSNAPGATAASYPGTGTGRFVAIFQTSANVLQFGAKGDGATDDSDRIQAAITAIDGNGGGDVFFPQPATSYVHAGVTVADNDTRLIGVGLPVDLAGGAPTVIYGSGSPESVVSAPVGSTFRRLDGSQATAVYIKGSGAADTGWIPIGFLSGSATYDPPNLVDGDGATTTVTVTGAALGDFVEASFSLDLQGITLTAWVSAADTVSVRFQNESGGALDLASGTLVARVRK
jgi:hypothetical protein